ncbi:hypothetical protein ABEB36_015257 [Hypothenemus hampei]|uniref:Transcription factor Adf-1 n=1 Tax=Hypothenemus hampei TaxID=57062 RepID=A0ABD1E164_HYPHA
MARFSVECDDLLIEGVQKHSCLYSFEHENYKDINVKENCWREIATSVGRSVVDCKKRWKNMKDTYFRKKKNSKLGTGSSSSVKPIKWSLFRQLEFLENVKTQRASKNTAISLVDCEPDNDIDNTENEAIINLEESINLQSPQSSVSQKDDEKNGNSSNSLGSSPSSFVPRKRVRENTNAAILRSLEERSQKRMEILKSMQIQNEPEDDVDLFMRSISVSIKKLPPELIAEAKLNILTLVTTLQNRKTIPTQM